VIWYVLVDITILIALGLSMADQNDHLQAIRAWSEQPAREEFDVHEV